jgi:hypothetical protein
VKAGVGASGYGTSAAADYDNDGHGSARRERGRCILYNQGTARSRTPCEGEREAQVRDRIGAVFPMRITMGFDRLSPIFDI